MPAEDEPPSLDGDIPASLAEPVELPHLPPVVWKRTWVDDRPAYYGVSGEGLPVLFLHGWGLGHRTYKNVIQRIAGQGCRVIAPAQPGFGGTAGLPRVGFSLSGYARWVCGFLDALRVREPVVVMGHSFGGGVAIRLAHDFSDRVRSLVLVNSIGGSAWHRGGRLRSLRERPLWDWGLHFPADVWPVAQATKVLPVMLADVVPNVIRNPMAIWKVGHLARAVDLTRELEEIKRRGLPVTVLWGNRDGIIPRESFEAMCVALGATGRVVTGSHSWLLADPQGFGEVITNDLEVAKVARQLEATRGKARRPLSRSRPDRIERLDRPRGGDPPAADR